MHDVGSVSVLEQESASFQRKTLTDELLKVSRCTKQDANQMCFCHDQCLHLTLRSPDIYQDRLAYHMSHTLSLLSPALLNGTHLHTAYFAIVKLFFLRKCFVLGWDA